MLKMNKLKLSILAKTSSSKSDASSSSAPSSPIKTRNQSHGTSIDFFETFLNLKKHSLITNVE